ncbi:amidohydrolase family protein [Longimicrobium sp.]|uniref:amidohydrolase family protein n=1 Tax=Longimicrobium sp. TaxID=2029185 RepID=UPI003B3A3F80
MKSAMLLTLVALAGCAAQAARTAEVSAEPATVLRGRLIDGTGAAPVENGVVVIQAERITCAGAASSCRIPAGAEVIDAAGGTILPGLIDLHAHVWDAGMLSMFLPAGVTTVRDLHNTFENLAVLDAGTGPAPRLFRAGPLIDGRQSWPGAMVAADVPAAVRAVDTVAAHGVDFVKLYSGLSLAQVTAASAEARRLGKPVTADLLASEVDALQALEAGVQGFEHAGGFAQAYRRMGGDPESFPLDSVRMDSLARAVVRRNAYIVPTLIVAHQYAAETRPSLAGVPLADRVPDHVHAFWARGDAAPASFKHVFDVHEQFATHLTRRVAALGGRVGVGSDLPNPYVTPGGALHQELELLVGAGLTPLQAIRAATGGAADILGRADLGVLAAGRAADVIVVGGNPAADVRATRDVRVVIHNGRVLPMETLLAAAPPVRGSRPAAPAADPAPVPDASKLALGRIVYGIVVGADTTGTDTMTLESQGGRLLLTETSRTPAFTMDVRAEMSAPAMTPLTSDVTQEMGGNRIQVQLQYGAGRVTGTMKMPPAFGGETALDTPFEGPVYESAAVPQVIAALPLREGAVWTLPVYTTYVRAVAPYRVEVGAVETVQTGTGPVRAFKVQVKAGAFAQVLWISEAEPRWLVATEIAAFGMRSVARSRLP